MKNLLLTLLCLITVLTRAQDQGEVHFLVDVDNGYFEIVVDDTMYLKLYKCTLPVGHHTAKVWSPGYITTEVDFDVAKDQLTEKYVEMAISNERMAFEREYKEYRMKFHKSLSLSGTITLATALTSTVFMTNAYLLKNKIYDHIDLYYSAPNYDEPNYYRESIADNNRRYNRQRTFFYTTVGLTVAALGTTIFTYTRFKRNNTEPTFNQESPFKDRFSMNVTPLGCQFIYRL